jgi:hypothetical protein
MEELLTRGHYGRSYCSTVLRWVYSRSNFGANVTDVVAVLNQLNIQDAAPPSEEVVETPIGMTLATITEQLNNLPGIRVQGLLKKREETLKEFLIKFFTKWNHTKPTVFADSKAVQTPAAKRRSLGDIYKICKYYYPKTNLKQVRNLLYTTLHNEVPRFRSSYCNQIHKRVWYQGSATQGAGVFDKTHADEYGLGWDNWLNLE